MKILILTMNVGGNAPGIVFERLISGLSNHHMVDVLTVLKNEKINLPKVNNIEVLPYLNVLEFRKSQLILLFGFNPMDLIWAYKVKNKIKQSKAQYDIVISFLSNEHYAGLIAGVIVSKFLKTKLAAYSVDAIPAPLGWSIDDLYYRSCKKFISYYLSKVDVFFAANIKMLNYQKSFLRTNHILFDVIYNPSPLKLSVFNESKTNVFLYTGEIYKVRRVKYIFNALKLILKEYPKVELHFVGSDISDDNFKILNDVEREAVKIFPRTNDLNPHYEKSFCLIDIDADIENDVYLSSKITNYLMINRPIICETGENSPSKQLFHGIPSILQCGHNSKEIYQLMKKLIENPISNFSDRTEVIEKFSLDSIIQVMNEKIFEIKNIK